MQKGKYIFIVLLFIVQLLSAKELNYLPKSLEKELSKKWGIITNELVEIISLSEQLIKEGRFFKIENTERFKGYVFVGRIYSCRAGGCSNTSGISTTGNSEYFDVYIIYNNDKAIESVRVFNYQATHGHEISSKGWLKQFANFNGDKILSVGKNIDAISGATISVHAITDEVNYITELLSEY